MNVAIFGANGGTGRLLTRRCLTAGDAVTALLRNPAVFPYGDRVHVVQGDAFNPAAVRKTVEGADVVFSTLGAHSPFRNENVLPRAVPLIIEAMQKTGVRRIVVLGSAGALGDSLRKQPVWRRLIVEKIVYKAFLKWPVLEQIAQYKLLSASDLDWTMVMPPMLTNGDARKDYRVDGEALPRNGSRISREDVADFMMLQINDDQWVRKGVYIAY
jgi:putative NADH-flavin reductase